MVIYRLSVNHKKISESLGLKHDGPDEEIFEIDVDEKSIQKNPMISALRRNSVWMYDPVTLEQRQIQKEDISNYEGWIRGRVPNPKLGGRRGVYSKERASKFTAWKKANNHNTRGYKHTEEAKKKMSEARRKRDLVKKQVDPSL